MLRLNLRQNAIAVLLCGGVFALSGSFASAQETGPAATALDDWVQQIDALPEIEASYESLTGRGDTAVLTGLTIQGTGILMVFEPISVSGYHQVGADGFAFEHFEVGRIQGRTPTTEVNVIDFWVDNIVVPETGFVFDQDQPITSILDIWGQASQISIDEISIGRIDIAQYYGGLDSLVSYHNYVIRGWADGRIASTSAGPLVMESPADDAMFVMTVDDIQSQDMDFNAIAWVLDPAAYAGGNRDWQTVLGHAEYNNIQVRAPDLQLRISSIAIDDFKMRQATEPFTPVLERLMTEDFSSRQADELTQQILVDLISPWGIGNFSIQGLDIYADQIDRFHLGDIHITDLSLDGLGEIGLSDLDVVISGSGYLRLGTLALGGIDMPSEKVLKRVLDSIAAGDEPSSIQALFPTVAYVEIAGFEFANSSTLPIRLDRFLINDAGYVGPAPTEGRIELAGLTVPLSVIQGDVRRILNQMGYTQFTLDLGVTVSWDEATETLHIDDIHLAIGDVGSIEASFVVGGVTRAIFENLDSVGESTLAQLTFDSANIRVTDASLADRLFAFTAEGTDTPPDQYRQDFIRGLPFLLGMSMNREIALQISPALQEFLRQPSVLVADVNPAEPVLLADLANVTDPFSLIGILGVELSVDPLE